jgi:hypothetical protein
MFNCGTNPQCQTPTPQSTLSTPPKVRSRSTFYSILANVQPPQEKEE